MSITKSNDSVGIIGLGIMGKFRIVTIFEDWAGIQAGKNA